MELKKIVKSKISVNTLPPEGAILTPFIFRKLP